MVIRCIRINFYSTVTLFAKFIGLYWVEFALKREVIGEELKWNNGENREDEDYNTRIQKNVAYLGAPVLLQYGWIGFE